MPELSAAITEYIDYRRSVGMATNTVNSNQLCLSRFLRVVGDINTRSITPVHGERWKANLVQAGFGAATIGTHHSALSGFFGWCRHRGYLRGSTDPLATVRRPKITLAPRRRIPASEFPRLLDAARYPQYRIAVALGLYLFLRNSEVAELHISDLDLGQGLIRVYQPKTDKVDLMPVCEELDQELRRWLTYYTNDVQGPLHPDWYLVPAQDAKNWDWAPRAAKQMPVHGALAPTRQARTTGRSVRAVLSAYGWEELDGEGGHTLRRSGARALFDQLIEEESRDGVLRFVSSMLHHNSVLMTERYLGLDVDREKRDVRLKGRRMFSQTPANVVRLAREA